MPSTTYTEGHTMNTNIPTRIMRATDYTDGVFTEIAIIWVNGRAYQGQADTEAEALRLAKVGAALDIPATV